MKFKLFFFVLILALIPINLLSAEEDFFRMEVITCIFTGMDQWQNFQDQDSIETIEDKSELANVIKNLGGTVLQAPSIRQEFDVPVSIQLVSEVQYIEKQPDNTLISKYINSEDSAGFWLETIVSKERFDNELLVDYSMLIRTIADREPVEDLNLPVGKPLFKEYEFSQTHTMKPEEWLILEAVEIEAGAGNPKKILTVLCRIAI